MGNIEGSEMAHTQHMKPMNTWERLQAETQNPDLMKARLVNEKGYPNMFGARIPVESQWNIEKLEELLQDYQDKEILEGLRFGWPTGRLPSIADPEKTFKNHKGATDYPQALQQYIQKENQNNALLGHSKQYPLPPR